MFTGIIQELGRIVGFRNSGDGAVIRVEAQNVAKCLSIGDSVAVSGVCLTATSVSSTVFEADVAKETLNVTTLGSIKVGDPVNLEPALMLSDRLGGHMVSGHVDGIGRLLSRTKEGASERFKLECPPEVAHYAVKKGSVAVDGISLTIADVKGSIIDIAVIPHTAMNTTLGSKSPGSALNLEADIIGKYVEKLLGERAQSDGPEINNRHFDLFKESGLL